MGRLKLTETNLKRLKPGKERWWDTECPGSMHLPAPGA